MTSITGKTRKQTEDGRPAIWVGYGRLVKLFREQAGMTQQQLAEALAYSVELVGSVEQGRRPAKTSFTEAAESVLDARGALRALQDGVDLARLPVFFRDFALLETEAVSRFSYDPLLVPGLLQTEEYARTLLEAHSPPLDDHTVDERLAARMKRQVLLSRKQPSLVFVFIIEESVLHRAVGGHQTMRAQLERLLECGRLRNVEIQVMPSDRLVHSGLNGLMVLLETVERQRIVFTESQGFGSVLSDRELASEFSLRYGTLRSQALDTEQSARLIERMAGET